MQNKCPLDPLNLHPGPKADISLRRWRVSEHLLRPRDYRPYHGRVDDVWKSAFHHRIGPGGDGGYRDTCPSLPIVKSTSRNKQKSQEAK
jgi:hypothetical protein